MVCQVQWSLGWVSEMTQTDCWSLPGCTPSSWVWGCRDLPHEHGSLHWGCEHAVRRHHLPGWTGRAWEKWAWLGGLWSCRQTADHQLVKGTKRSLSRSDLDPCRKKNSQVREGKIRSKECLKAALHAWVYLHYALKVTDTQGTGWIVGLHTC